MRQENFLLYEESFKSDTFNSTLISNTFHINKRILSCNYDYVPKLDKNLEVSLQMLICNDAPCLCLQINHAKHLRTKILSEIKHKISS